MIYDYIKVVYDDDKRKYYVVRKDCPGEELHEITFGAVLDLNHNLQRYQQDYYNETHRQ